MFLKFLRKSDGKGAKDSLEQVEKKLQLSREMNYCPKCGVEYRPGINICAGCAVALISGAEKLAQVKREEEMVASRTMEILPTDELLTIQKGLIKDIKALQKLLAKERIPAIIAGDEGCAKGCCGPEMFLQIRKEDMDVAAEVLTKDFVKSTALESHDITNATAVFDHLAKETVCPACGCCFSPTVGACPECGLCFE